jgi:hypothetical protein
VSRRSTAWLLACVLTACAGGLEEAGEELSPPVASPTTPVPTASIVTGPPTGPATGPSGATGETAPAIVVTSPGSGDDVVSPVTIAGTADVFEATVSVRILDASGTELAAGFATATCGSGCRGEFSTSLAFFTPTRQPGSIEVFESSAVDGSPIHLVRIPVVLVPGE